MNKRREYLLYTLIAFSIGFIIYGMLAVIARNQINYPFSPIIGFFLYGFQGGILIGGFLSGILLFTSFIKTKKQLIKILSIILFPITFIVIVQVGIISFIPYWIYNLIQLNKK